MLQVDEQKLPKGTRLLDVVVELQLSYFADLRGLQGLLDYFEDKSRAQYFASIAENFTAQRPRRPISKWKAMEDPDLTDLVVRMTNVDPTRRLTATEALAHRWFADVP